ncbi:9881_t:CDS:2 [Funneliformis geosporum]|nr:9881_t:CDS:2 [Funneliformis geosporum]
MEDDTLEALSRLSLDLLNFLQTQDYENLLSITDSFPEYYSKENQFDVIVRIDGEDYYCNSDVLISRSSYFRTALSQNYAAKEGSYTIVKESNIPPDTFKTMLRYFYQGDINLNKLDGGLCVNLLRAAEHFRLESFIEDLQRHIIHNKTLWLQHNFIRVVNGVFTMDGDERIRHHLVHKLNDNPWYLLKSDELGALRSSCLISLMEDECFIVNQGIVWDILIRWGIQQSSTLRLDAPNWTYEDWMTLKGAVKDLIPRVKFSGISRNDYYGKILPFNKIISVKESSLEAEEVLICYLNKDIVSPHSKLLRQILLDDSSIINHFHANIILKWINEGRRGQEKFSSYPKIKISFFNFFCFKKKRQQRRSPSPMTYQFNLLFRRSRDGFPAEDYRKKCDNLPNTLVIAKIHGSKAIIGGFAPRGLDLGFLTLYTPAIDSSFLFNFKNGDPSMEVENTILCKMRTDREIESEYIPYLWTGPRFGVKDLAIDLHKMKAISVPQYYDNPVHDSKEFNIDDVEVYQIVEY